MKPLNVLIGSDPELFVGNSSGVSYAIGRVGGSKTEPQKVPFGALQEDNVLIEYNIDPADSLEVFTHNIKAVLETGRSVLAEHGLDVVRNLSSYVFDYEVLEEAGPDAFVFGCEPDYNCWTAKQNVFPRDVNPNLRTAGGHLHIGFGHLQQASKRTGRNVVKMCDYLLGLHSVLLDPDDQRKQLYGKAGAMRHKSYGVEYRSLSNFWLFSDELIAWAYNGARAAYERLDDLKIFKTIIKGAEVQRIINENDKAAAEEACRKLGISV